MFLQADRERYDEAEFVYPYDLGAWNNIKQVTILQLNYYIVVQLMC